MDGVQINFLDELSSECDTQQAYKLCKNVSQDLVGFDVNIYEGLDKFISKIGDGVLYVLTAKVQQEVSGIIGALSFAPNGENGTLDYFGVNAPFQGKGIGSKMYSTLERFLITKGHSQISLRVPMDRLSFEIYKKWGFVPKYRTSDCRSFVSMSKSLQTTTTPTD